MRRVRDARVPLYALGALVSTQNDFYGHKDVLARYTGVRGNPPILGYLQHGWKRGSVFVDGPVVRGVPKLVWTADNERATRALGHWPVRAVGAPFLYLMRLRDEAPAPRPGALLAFPYHTEATTRIERDDERYAAHLAGRGATSVTVCLHPQDLENQAIRASYENYGFATTSNGSNRVDPLFLDRVFDLIAAHERVTTNRVCTAIFYAAALGRGVSISGPVPGIERGGSGPAASEAGRAERFQRTTFPELVDGVGGDAARELGKRELGAESLREPGELRRTLGWQQPRRLASRALGAATATRRALVRQR